jgi:hypothetical protein
MALTAPVKVGVTVTVVEPKFAVVVEAAMLEVAVVTTLTMVVTVFEGSA